MNNATDKVIFFYKHDGAVEACWTHNPEVGRSKLPRAKINQFIKQKQLCLKNWLIIGNSELRLGKKLQTTVKDDENRESGLGHLIRGNHLIRIVLVKDDNFISRFVHPFLLKSASKIGCFHSTK